MNCYFFLPVAFSQVLSRFESTMDTLKALEGSIKYAAPLITSRIVHIYLNGVAPAEFELRHYLHAISSRSRLEPTVTTGGIPDKIIAVNVGLDLARNSSCRAFFCVDNDIAILAPAVRHMLDIMLRRNPDGVVCEKAPKRSRGANDFQVAYSKFIELALGFQIFPNRRPTGSFYCIDPHKIPAFPIGTNEGDALTRFDIVHTNEFVYSDYPATAAAEISRRKRIAAASAVLNYVRDIQNIEFVEHIERHPPFPTSVRTDEFWRSFYLYKQVVAAVAAHEAGTAADGDVALIDPTGT